MNSETFLSNIKDLLLPAEYSSEITKNVPEDWLFLKKGSYILVAAPYDQIPEDDYSNKYIKSKIKEILFCFPLFAEKGLFLIYYGSSDQWDKAKESHRVDRTGLKPIILQSFHFIDPNTGENYNSRTRWGPVKFGFCGKVIEKVESYCSGLYP
jgi:hypothetical protein